MGVRNLGAPGWGRRRQDAEALPPGEPAGRSAVALGRRPVPVQPVCALLGRQGCLPGLRGSSTRSPAPDGPVPGCPGGSGWPVWHRQPGEPVERPGALERAQRGERPVGPVLRGAESPPRAWQPLVRRAWPVRLRWAELQAGQAQVLRPLRPDGLAGLASRASPGGRELGLRAVGA